MKSIMLTIDGVEVEAEEGMSVLEASKNAKIYIPNLCSHPNLSSSRKIKSLDSVYMGKISIKGDDPGKDFERCQLCLVEIEGIDGFPTACTTYVTHGMVVHTNTPKAKDLRQDNLAKLITHHPHACLICAQKEGCSREPCSSNVPVEERCCPLLGQCELEKVAEYIGIKDNISRYIPKNLPIIKDEPFFDRDYNL